MSRMKLVAPFFRPPFACPNNCSRIFYSKTYSKMKYEPVPRWHRPICCVSTWACTLLLAYNTENMNNEQFNNGINFQFLSTNCFCRTSHSSVRFDVQILFVVCFVSQSYLFILFVWRYTKYCFLLLCSFCCCYTFCATVICLSVSFSSRNDNTTMAQINILYEFVRQR